MGLSKLIKTILLTMPAIFFVVTVFAQQRPPKIYGTVYIDNTTLMDEREVSIGEWMAFIVNNNFDNSLFPDTAVVSPITKAVFNDLRKQNNFQYLKVVKNPLRYAGEKAAEPSKGLDKLADADPNYFSLNVPVTGVTFEQVQKFCKWKEDMINQNQKIKVTIGLPSVGMYKKVIPNIDSISKKGDCFVLNCSTAKCKTGARDKQSLSQGNALEHVNNYFPTSLGLYNIEGNAAEMTNIKGVAMGGSFRQTARESYNDKAQKYNKAEDWLGFRYIITAK
jgi:hypothetical protein